MGTLQKEVGSNDLKSADFNLLLQTYFFKSSPMDLILAALMFGAILIMFSKEVLGS